MQSIETRRHTSTPLELPFKGNRHYLHGTDIFNTVVALTQPNHGVSFRFHRMMRHPIDLVPVDNISRIASDAAGYCVLHGVEGHKDIWFFREAPSRQIVRRVAYDEDDVVVDAVHGVDSIVSPGPSNYSFIERTVALNKSMLHHRSDDDGPSAWLFTHLDLAEIPMNPHHIELHLAGSLGTTMAKSTINCEGRAIGHIAFWRLRN